MELSDAGFVASESSVKLGRLLRAEKVVRGNYSDEEASGLKIFSSLAGGSKGDELGEASAQGDLNEFFSMEKVIAFRILKDLGYSEDQIPESVKKIHTKNFKAFEAFSVGLDYFDREEYQDARDQFQNALEHDPDFKLARSMMLLTPLSSLTVSGIVSSVTASGPSSAAAAGGMSIGVKAGIAAGAAAGLGGGVALAAGGGGGNDNGSGEDGNADGQARICSTQTINGADPEANGPTTQSQSFDLLKTSGTFPFTWETGQRADRIIITYQNNTLFDSTCISESGTETISYSGESTEVTVSATPNCLDTGQTGTFWQYSIGCP